MVPVGRLTLVRTFAKSELIRAMTSSPSRGWLALCWDPSPAALSVATSLAIYLLREYTDRHFRFADGVSPVCRTIAKRKLTPSILSGSSYSVPESACCAYVLEIFGEHTLSVPGILGLLTLSLVLLAGYLLHAKRTAYPLLQLTLFRIRTFRAAVKQGSFFTRLGIGGVPFLLPLLYQVGLGFSAIQSGLLIMPQAIAAMSAKFLVPKILARVGFRGVLISNTVILGLLLILFRDHRAGRAHFRLIVLQAFCYGTISSLQYTA